MVTCDMHALALQKINGCFNPSVSYKLSIQGRKVLLDGGGADLVVVQPTCAYTG